jgi:hypothetical protein
MINNDFSILEKSPSPIPTIMILMGRCCILMINSLVLSKSEIVPSVKKRRIVYLI